MYLWLHEKGDMYIGDWEWQSYTHPDSAVISIDLAEGAGFVKGASFYFDVVGNAEYDPARCGAFADWLDDNKETDCWSLTLT